MRLAEDKLSDHNGARLMLDAPPAKTLLSDRGYDSNDTLLKTSPLQRDFGSMPGLGQEGDAECAASPDFSRAMSA
jgi:hypothetical protein